MKFFYFACFICFFGLSAHAQQVSDSGVRSRIIFIGDAGVVSQEQKALIEDAASKVIAGKTTVIFLGNNIYPDGMTLDDAGKRDSGGRILSSQYQPMREKGAAVYFIPGNRDWDNSGPDGLEKVMAESAYLSAQNDSLLKMIPPNACPDPRVVAVSDKMVVIALDTEWWLFPFDKDNEDTTCNCTTEDDVLASLRSLLYQNRGKSIILVTHHPFIGYGMHSGNLPWKAHLFPLTAVNPALYLPLPVIGSLYPLFAKVFPNRENLHHTNYQEMMRDILRIFRGYPDFIQVSSHENGLQMISGADTGQLQIVTGIGNAPRYTRRGKGTIFNTSNPGYVVADQINGGDTHLSFYGLGNEGVGLVFDFTRRYQPLGAEQNPVYSPIDADSVVVAVHPAYNDHGKFYRFLMGKNYRKAWAAPVKLPVFHLSKIHGGLTPEELGGGFQSVSLRLKNPAGKEYVLRSVEKTPDRIIPGPLMSSFSRNIVSDVYSSQHPFSALIVPPIAGAVGVPHAHPVIGVTAPGPALGAYQPLFARRVDLLEEREPLPGTDNFKKALKELKDDNDNGYDALNFLNARMMDLLIGDWDRHPDQWRFHDLLKGKNKYYIAIPRDRDIALNVTNGLLETIAKYFYLTPRVRGFKKNLLSEVNQYLSETRFMEPFMSGQLNYDVWMNAAHQFKNAVTDSVLRAAMAALPRGLDSAENATILETLKARRDLMPEAMDKYYKFDNRVVDIQGSDKNEFFSFKTNSDTLFVSARKIDKDGELGKMLMAKAFPAAVTKEIRLYLNKGTDSVYVDNTTPIRLRLIGSKQKKDDYKAYDVANSKRKVRIYDRTPERYYGDTSRVKKHIAGNRSNTAFVPFNPYNIAQPLLSASINKDDGVSLDVGMKFIKRGGFRKLPYSSVHKLIVGHSFATSAFRLKYSGDWVNVIGKAHFILDADIFAPHNTQNFFGVGNETPLDKTVDVTTFYRTRFNTYSIRPALKFESTKGGFFSIGPSLQYYQNATKNNSGRFITHEELLHSFDSATIDKGKMHLGIVADYELDRRNDKLLPTTGVHITARLGGYAGVTTYADSYAQLLPEGSFYRNLNRKQTLVLANRLGGAVTVGKPAFYQYAYLGGQGNLLGYRKFRFAGMNALYDNLVVRLALANFGNDLMKGQIGISGLYDIGRVWTKDDISDKWHHGIGGGIYLAPAYMAVLQFNISHSDEGWYPFFTFGFRF